MQFIQYYDSPIGKILLTADETGLTGLFPEGEEWVIAADHTESDCPVLAETRKWLDIYFSGNFPDFTPPIHASGTEFQEEVWQLLLDIPYGEVTTYGAIAQKVADARGLSRMSAQAVGGAVGSNPISIIVPCHRVVGSSGNLTGYASGIDKKIALLTLEGLDMSRFKMPK